MARFPGFGQMTFSPGTSWEYAWRETAVVNGNAEPTRSGIVRMHLAHPVEVNIGGAGAVRLFETTASARRGGVPTWWPRWRYLGFKDGTFFAAVELDSHDYGAVSLFDSNTGEVDASGFMGWFANPRQRSVAMGTISSPFLTTAAVIAEEPFSDRESDTIGALRILDGERHDYSVREYYLPGKGFGGWFRRGVSIYSGGGYVDFLELALEVDLITCTGLR